MAIKRQKRLKDGSMGPLESVRGLPDIDPNLLAAFEAIALQNELIEELKAEVETLKGEVE